MMGHQRLANAIKLHAGGMDMNAAAPRHAIITAYDPASGAVKVQIQPEGVQTGWIACGHPGVGASCIVVAPNIGDQVFVAPQEDDGEQWVVTARVFDAVSVPPSSPATGAPPASGEIALFHSSGSYIHFVNDGTVHSQAGAGGWFHKGQLTVNGNILATGNVSDLNAQHGSLSTLRATYNGHTHVVENVQEGGQSPSTNAPTQQDT